MNKQPFALVATASALAAVVVGLAACGSSTPAPTATQAPTTAPTTAPTEVATTTEVSGPARPDPDNEQVGAAVGLTGDVTKGKTIYVANCQKCHGPEGTTGIPNPGSDDGTVPSLNPIDETLINSDAKVYATNLDLFIEHGSTPAGTKPTLSMPAWGDGPIAPYKKLAPQEIADVIAYIMSLNPAK
jgi:mono/diheme cytochrome c family protein